MEPSVVETRQFARRQRPRVLLQKQLRIKDKFLVVEEETPVRISTASKSFDAKIWTRIA